MRDKQYKVKTVRADESVWQSLNKIREKEKLSWNMLFNLLIELYAKKD